MEVPGSYSDWDNLQDLVKLLRSFERGADSMIEENI